MPLLLRILSVILIGQGVCYGKDNPVEKTPPYYYYHGQPETALSMYTKAASTGNVAAALDASMILQELGRNDRAISLLENALTAAPDNASLGPALAWAYLFSGANEKAGGMFALAARKNDKDARVLLGLALSHMRDSKTDEAVLIFQKLKEDRHLAPLALYFLGRISEETGNPAKAAEFYGKALKADSHFVEARSWLAGVYEQQGQPDDAWEQYYKIASMDPSNKLAADRKKTLLAMLTKKPEEILKVKKIAEFSSVGPSPQREQSPEIRIGVGTGPGGSPLYAERISFRVSGPFAILDTKTGKELAASKSTGTWTVSIVGGVGNSVPPLTPKHAESGSTPNLLPGKTASAKASAVISAPDGRTFPMSSRSVLVRQKEPGKGTIILESVPYAPGMAWSGVADKELRGNIEIVHDQARKGLYVISRLPLEEYLYGVVAAEMPIHWPAEALKAQAVIARTYALYVMKNLRPHAAHGYDLCDEQHCQVYSGVPVESRKGRSVVDQTWGRVLTYNGKPLHAVFSSNCGGLTQSGAAAGWGDMPYWRMVYDGREDASGIKSPSALASFLKGFPDVYCRASQYTWAPEFRWTRYIPGEELAARLRRRGNIGQLKKIVFIRGESGRVASVRFAGSRGELKLTKEHEIRRLFGIAPLRSTMFVADVFYWEGAIKGLLIYGGGWGHGVGLCQSGAAGRAESGAQYEQILPAYYPGAALSDVRDAK